MAVGPSSGSKIFIGTTNLSGNGDTYQEIGEVTNMGEFGRVYQKIPFDSLGNRSTQKFKGQRDDGTMQIDLGRNSSDVGQAAVKVALDSDQDYNFKVLLNDQSAISGSSPTSFLFKAKIMSYTTNVGGPNSVVASRLSLEVKTGSIIETVAT